MDKNRLQKLANIEENKEINIKYYQTLLNQSTKLSHDSRKYIQNVINSVKKQNNIPTERQLAFLQRVAKGDFNYHPKN